MQAQASPLEIIINPPGIQLGMPGDTIKLHAVVINQGDQSAVIDLSFIFDDEFKNLTGWSIVPQESLAIAPQQTSDEVTFEFHIPVDALPGTYDYTLVVDAPLHYPQDTPINFPLQLKILLKEQTVVRVNDPTFSLKPSSNTNKPLIFNPGEPLEVEVTVENRSNRVDRLRLTCPDLDEDWFTITYPTTGLEGLGVSEVTALGLNPGSQGQILLTFHPSEDILAGVYSPTIRLHSENLPELVLLDLVYIRIPTIYRLDVQFQTILAQVSRSPAKYELSLINQGNVVRELTFNLESRDEEELYTYKFQPNEVRLLPSKISTANLTVKPRHWWRRPWLGGGLVINFQVNIQDKQSLPLPNTLPQLSFVWKPRPWWQFLLLILLMLGLLGGIGFIVWQLLNPAPLKLEKFVSNSSQIIEGEEVVLNWQVQNSQQLQKLELTITEPQGLKTTEYDFSNGIPENLANICREIPKKELICSNLKTGVKAKGKYSFKLQVFTRKGMPFLSQKVKIEPKTIEVEINEKPIAELIEFKTDKLEYTKDDLINLSWKISSPLLLRKIEITGKAEDNTLLGQPISYEFNEGNIADPKRQNRCREENQQLECTNISIPASKAGKFTFEIKAFSNNVNERNSSKKTESVIEILPKPFRIISFRINGTEEPIRELQEGETAILSWNVEGEDIRVKLDPIGDVPPVGSRTLQVNRAFPSQIKLQVNDKLGRQQSQEKAFSFTVIPKVEPTPILPIPESTPIFPGF
ncbi:MULTISPECIES: hypothetical protein [Cyanophyceae]|uniref:COG1470 family protein n=1 Tax=Cyanophyceae TaxID=3028117 RepID=UPI00232CE709|nr:MULTISPECIES: hypothetical protein [Cyanophyceae]MDB9355749.1 hypothetical protein [Nodularia spumigena CS-587/03]MDB9341360.1 hypothetical protein [Nodularia spumigena CS-589/07]MDB9399153.1 hypothetical protein [Microcystis aeruginosa CS-567/02-A1]MDB9500212.1 hypothetical protein [Nodularia spumigena CS-336/02]MDB9533478.1 hypothetical protein [Nodularia spumigena CS-1038]